VFELKDMHTYERRRKKMRGFVYTIRAPQSDLIYYGSTSQPLSQRMAKHRSDYKAYLAGKGGRITSFVILALGNAYIELVRIVDYEVKAELHAAEGECIRNNPCVNKQQMGRTNAQYRIDNAEKISAKHKEYYAANVDKIATYYIDYAEEIRAKVAAYKAANAAKLKERHACDCGGCYTTPNQADHFRTAKHKAWAAQAI